MHNAALAELGLNWRYLAFDVPPARLGDAIAGARTLGFIGLNLTVPHKLLAVGLVDALDDSARSWGAVNTIRFEARTRDGDWRGAAEVRPEEIHATRACGFNTDADALVCSLAEDLGLTLAGAEVVVLGAGGAGRVAALRLAQEGAARLWLVNRTRAKAEAVAAEVRQRWPGVAVAVGHPPAGAGVDLILNATSLGLQADDPPPLDPAAMQPAQARAAYDMIYRPAETPFLRAARGAGCRTANGLGMLLHQGARALEIWTGRPAPIATMRGALERSVYGG